MAMSKVLLGDISVEHKETCKGSKDGYPIVGLEHLIPEEITLTAWDEGTENTFTKMFRKGNVLFGRRRAYLKKAAVAPFDGICSCDITVIEAKPDCILPELLPFIIQNDALFDFAVGKSAGSLSPRVKWEHLKNYEFELPDMDKQRKLVALLWAMVDTKKSYQKLIASTDELVKSQFIEQFVLKDAYPLVPISSLVNRAIKKRKDLSEKFDVIRYIDISSIDNAVKQITGYVEYPINDAPSRAQQVIKEGDILVSTVRPNLQNIAINPYSDDNLVASTGFCVLRCSKCLPEYLWGIISSDAFTQSMCEQASGISYPAVRDSNILQYRVPNAPLPLQEQFAAFVRQSDKSKFELEKALAELTATYKRIIADNLG
jgi:type I restriction enzyme S subunit